MVPDSLRYRTSDDQNVAKDHTPTDVSTRGQSLLYQAFFLRRDVVIALTHLLKALLF